MHKSKTIEEVNFDVDEFLCGRDSPHAILVGFYKELCALFGIDWDNVEWIEPVNIRLSKEDWGRMCGHMSSLATSDGGRVDLGFMFVNKGPGNDDDVPVGTIRLLDGWIKEVGCE